MDHDKKTIDSHKSDEDQHSKWLQEIYNGGDDATFDLRVQLCEDIKDQPVEDCGQEWDEKKYPVRTVARVRIPASQSNGTITVSQDPVSPARRKVWDGLSAHRPLGSTNRLRGRLYAASAKLREHGNAVQLRGVHSSNEIP